MNTDRLCYLCAFWDKEHLFEMVPGYEENLYGRCTKDDRDWCTRYDFGCVDFKDIDDLPPSQGVDIATRLMDLAGQENCDGEPYDTMQLAAERIRELENLLFSMGAMGMPRVSVSKKERSDD